MFSMGHKSITYVFLIPIAPYNILTSFTGKLRSREGKWFVQGNQASQMNPLLCLQFCPHDSAKRQKDNFSNRKSETGG